MNHKDEKLSKVSSHVLHTARYNRMAYAIQLHLNRYDDISMFEKVEFAYIMEHQRRDFFFFLSLFLMEGWITTLMAASKTALIFWINKTKIFRLPWKWKHVGNKNKALRTT